MGSEFSVALIKRVSPSAGGKEQWPQRIVGNPALVQLIRAREITVAIKKDKGNDARNQAICIVTFLIRHKWPKPSRSSQVVSVLLRKAVSGELTFPPLTYQSETSLRANIRDPIPLFTSGEMRRGGGCWVIINQGGKRENLSLYSGVLCTLHSKAGQSND